MELKSIIDDYETNKMKTNSGDDNMDTDERINGFKADVDMEDERPMAENIRRRTRRV